MRKAGGTKDPAAKVDTEKALKHFMTHKHGDFINIPINQIKADPEQPRKEFNDDKLKELSDSIKDNGVLQPLLIRVTNDQFWIVAGERRYIAAGMAGLKSIPCIVTTGNPEEISLIENIQRDDLKPLELANAFERMMEKHGYNQTQLGKIVGKSRKTVSAVLSIKKLPNSIIEDLSRMRDKGDGIVPISRRVLVDIAQGPPEKAEKLYDAAKKGATSKEIREQRQPQTINKNSAEEIVTRKMQAVTKFLDRIDDTKRLKTPILKEMRILRDKLNILLQ